MPTATTSTAPARAADRWLLAGAGLVLLAHVVALAWLSDDAYITLRTVDNLVAGYGARWNVAERVQAYTHPLWMALLAVAYGLTREAYLTTLVLQFGLTAAFVVQLARAAPLWTAVPALLILAGSNAFTEFSTAGLENPLSHALLGALFVRALARDDARVSPASASTIAGLCLLVRLDLLLLILPVWLWQLQGRITTAVRGLAIGLSPLIAWEGFAIFYYGWPFPNTAYAKLGAGVPAGELARQGGVYLLDSLLRDPITLPTIAAGCVAGLASRAAGARWIAAGIVLHLAYVVRVGGDFMSGRFLTPALAAAIVLLCLAPPRRVAIRRAVLWALVACGAIAAGTRWAAGALPAAAYLDPAVTGIVDERLHYADYTGLWQSNFGARVVEHPWAALGQELRGSGRQFFEWGAVGLLGFHAGPRVHVLDGLALADPLLAQLPARRPWRVGHYAREIPAGYRESLMYGSNRLRDPALSRYYEHVRVVTRGPLRSRSRLRSIWLLNVGALDHLAATSGAAAAGAPRDESGVQPR